MNNKNSQDRTAWNQEEPQPVAVPLHNYQVRHGTDSGTAPLCFVGRDQLLSDLCSLLDKTRDSRGCYLIAGVRGSGKTTLINKVLKQHDCDNPGTYTNDGPLFEASIGGAEERWLKKCREKINGPGNCHSGKTSRTKNFLDFLRDLRRPKYLAPLIEVRVDLGQDERLNPREVLFNTATLLYRAIQSNPGNGAGQRVIHALARRWLFLLLAFSGGSATTSLLKLGWFKSQLSSVLLTFGSSGYIPPFFGPLLFVLGALFVYRFSVVNLTSYLSLEHKLKRLHRRMAYTEEQHGELTSAVFTFGRKHLMPPLDARQIERELLNLLHEARRIYKYLVKPDIVFVFDELDKIALRNFEAGQGDESDSNAQKFIKDRQKRVDYLLSALKGFITQGRARFFFIGGREMLDSYHSERGSASSLYESLFNRTFEVPSLLTDPSDHNSHRLHSLIEIFVCRQLLDTDMAQYLWFLDGHKTKKSNSDWLEGLNRKIRYSPYCLRTYYQYLLLVPDIESEQARRIILVLKNFVQFLTLHSWGNPKRLISLFEHFTKHRDSIDWRTEKTIDSINQKYLSADICLQFGVTDQQRIIISSDIYTLLYHDMGRLLARSGDKVVVSAMAAMQYILKFHRYPFSRNHLETMADVISKNRSPEINTTIDTLLARVLKPHIRRIRNSHYRYRFTADFEQELRYISRVSDIESAAFNFSLDANAHVKVFYQSLLEQSLDQESRRHSVNSIDTPLIYMVLGDLCFLEQSYSQAHVYYQRAIDYLDTRFNQDKKRFSHFYVEVLMRIGEMYERRQRYGRAASVYLTAITITDEFYRATAPEFQLGGDSKWDIMRQPYWAYWYLKLKRSPVGSRQHLPGVCESSQYPLDAPDDPVCQYRSAQLAFFYSCHYTAVKPFLHAIAYCGITKSYTEKTVYLGAYAYLNLAENLIVGFFRYSADSDTRAKASVEDSLLLNSLSNQLESLQGLHQLDEFVASLESSVTAELLCREPLGEMLSSTNKLGMIYDEQSLRETFSLKEAFGMIIYAARLLHSKGLHYHSALAYQKLLAIWGMLIEQIDTLFRIGNSINSDASVSNAKFIFALTKNQNWLDDLRREAEMSATALLLGGYDRFKNRFITRDTNVPFAKDSSVKTAHGNQHKPGVTKPNNKNIEDRIGTEWSLVESTMLAILGEKEKNDTWDNDKHKNMAIGLVDLVQYVAGKKPTMTDREFNSAINSQRSIIGQKLILYTLWGHMNCLRCANREQPLTTERPVKLDAQSRNPSSAKSLLYSHWLSGRRSLWWELERHECHEQSFIECAASTIHNFYRASYYVRQISGNDHDITFPAPVMIILDLWRTLYKVVDMKIESGILKTDFGELICDIQDEFISNSSLRSDAPAWAYNYENVFQRLLEALSNTAHIGDISNSTRTGVIKTKYFLSDDYEDPRFHLNWSLVQMYSALAPTLIDHVIQIDNGIREKIG